jgi:hypothetical protein
MNFFYTGKSLYQVVSILSKGTLIIYVGFFKNYSFFACIYMYEYSMLRHTV